MNIYKFKLHKYTNKVTRLKKYKLIRIKFTASIYCYSMCMINCELRGLNINEIT